MKSIFTLMAIGLVGTLSAQLYPCENGLAGPYPCDDVDVMSFIPNSDFGAIQNLNDIWGWTDAESGREFALVGMNTGTAFVEVTDAEHPVFIGTLPTSTTSILWRDVKVYNDYAYIVSEAGGHGLQSFDLSQLIAADAQVADFPLTFEETQLNQDFGDAHNIVINEEVNRAYVVGSDLANGGLAIFELGDAGSMTLVGDYGTSGYTHDAQVVTYNGPDEEYQGRQIAFCSNETIVVTVDVEDPTDPETLDVQGYSQTGYTHQCWLSYDHSYLLVNDELDETQGLVETTRTLIWDVRDLENIELIGEFTTGSTSIDHNMYVENYFAYMSNYRSGLRIADVSSIADADLQEVAYFDCQPSNDNPSFSGTWSNYPYFASGNIVMTDMFQGFFVLRANATASTSKVIVPCGEQDEAIAFVDFSRPHEAASFELSSLPLGVSATLPAEVVSPGRNEIVLSGLSGLSFGEYNFTYTITRDGVVEQQQGAIVVQSAIAEPTEISPNTEALMFADQITFSWQSAGEDVTYIVEWANDADFTDMIASETTMETSVSVDYSLSGDTEGAYFWRVSAESPCGIFQAGEGTPFTVLPQSIRELEAVTFEIWPNPASEVLNISKANMRSTFTITDAIGREVKTGYLTTSVLDIVDLKAGVYQLNIEGQGTAKFVKQ